MSENNADVNNNNEISNYTAFTINEVVNVIGENYVTTAKRVKALVTRDNLKVSEKLINNRPVTVYYLSTKELSELKATFTSLKMRKPVKSENDINADTEDISENKKDEAKDDIIVKYCKLIEDNTELKKNYDDLQKDYQKATNDLVQANADLNIIKNDLRFIEDKQKTFEAENSRLTQELSKQEKALNTRNIIIIALSVILIIIATVAVTILLLH